MTINRDMRNWIDLFEAPISLDPSMLAQEKPDSVWRPDDRGILNSPKGKAKLERTWTTSVADLHVIFADPNVSRDDVLTDVSYGSASQKATAFQGIEVEKKPDVITLIMSNNEGSERYPLTAWMIAHRLYHAFEIGDNTSAGDYDESLESGVWHLAQTVDQKMRHAFYTLRLGEPLKLTNDNGVFYNHKFTPDTKTIPEKAIGRLFGSIGRSKACRDFNLTLYGEMINECFAGYILGGSITLKRFRSEETTPMGVFYFEPEKLQKVNEAIDVFEETMRDVFPKIIDRAKGRVFSL